MDKVHALLTAYQAKRRAPRKKSTNHMPVGTQAQFIDAATAAAKAGAPLNTLLSLRWATMSVAA